MKKLSIGARLTLWYLMIFAAAQVCFGVGLLLVLRHHLYGIADNSLTAQVDDLTNLLKSQKKKNWTVPKLQEEVSEAYVLEHSGDFLQVYDQDSNWIFRSRFLEQNQLSPIVPGAIRNRSFENIVLENHPFRFITQRIDVNGRAYTVQTGVPIDEIIATLTAFQRWLLMLAPMVLVAAAAGGYWLSHKALSPVDAITRTARSITGSNLTARLEKLTTGDELQRLTDTLNEMLARIEGAFLRITQFTADASHELRTPVSLIRTEAEIALRKLRKDHEYREALQHILLEAERTSSLVEELLLLARADAGRENLDFAPINICTLMREISSEWRQLVEARNLQFAEAIADCELMVLADRAALRRLLYIVLDNAVKYTPPPGAVELRLEARANHTLIVIRDTGIGIAEEDQTKIFQRFYRVDKARSREVGGAGIGLAIADWIVQQHGGVIKVRSSIGKGASFYIELPLQSIVCDSSESIMNDTDLPPRASSAARADCWIEILGTVFRSFQYGPLRARVVEKKKEEMKEYVESLIALMGQYLPPNGEKVKAALPKAEIIPPASGIAKIVLKDYVKPGDSMTLSVNADSRKLDQIAIASKLNDDPVSFQVDFARLPDGTNYPSLTKIKSEAKQLELRVMTSDYHK